MEITGLLEYAIAADTDGTGFPEVLESDDGKIKRSWQFWWRAP